MPFLLAKLIVSYAQDFFLSTTGSWWHVEIWFSLHRLSISVAPGEGVEDFRPGDHVIPCCHASCGRCSACRRGDGPWARDFVASTLTSILLLKANMVEKVRIWELWKSKLEDIGRQYSYHHCLQCWRKGSRSQKPLKSPNIRCHHFGGMCRTQTSASPFNGSQVSLL